MLQLVPVTVLLLTDFLYYKVPNKKITLLGTATAVLFLLASVSVFYIYCNNKTSGNAQGLKPLAILSNYQQLPAS